MTQFGTIVADPPWQFKDSLPGPGRGASKHYGCMSLMDLRRLPEQLLAAPDCRLFLWRVASMQQEALDLMAAWGFELKSELVWVKTTASGKMHFGMGRQVRASHETCLIGVRGKPERLSASVRSVFQAAVGKHSEKPDEFYGLVQDLSPGPYLELFARRRRDGWTQHGDELEE